MFSNGLEAQNDDLESIVTWNNLILHSLKNAADMLWTTSCSPYKQVVELEGAVIVMIFL